MKLPLLNLLPEEKGFWKCLKYKRSLYKFEMIQSFKRFYISEYIYKGSYEYFGKRFWEPLDLERLLIFG